MLMQTDYLETGILFRSQSGKNHLSFPLDAPSKQTLRDADWDKLNALEQLWYAGCLIQEGDAFLLPVEEFLELDAETRSILDLPKHQASIGIEELGNIGSPNYRIAWFVMLHGRNAGKKHRFGAVVRTGGFDLYLSRAQYVLLETIEKTEVAADIEGRARFQARIKLLAKRAGVKTNSFMDSREFLFADTVEPIPVAENDHRLELRPGLSDLSEELQSKLPKRWTGGVRIQRGAVRTGLFLSPRAEEEYNRINSLDPLVDSQVPEFLENPMAFLPEDLEVDEDEFSARVKGLTIKRATASPYLHLEPRENGAWFVFETGIDVADNEDYGGEQIDSNDPELRERIKKAAAAGEKYVYHKGRWIKISPDDCSSFFEAESRRGQRSVVRSSDAKELLDIYENIVGLEYNEQALFLKQKGILPAAVPRSFCGELKDYQQDGYAFLKAHYDTGTGVILADDMGLGKTVQVIAVLAHMWDMDALSPSLIVVPSSLIYNWRDELQRFLPAVKNVYVHQGPYRYRQGDLVKTYSVVLTTYETLTRDQVILGKIRWHCVICDEIQKVKNFRTLAAGAVKGMNTSYRIAMTGTPVENRLSELWSIADFAQPGLLGSYTSFRREFEKPIQNESGMRESLSELLIERLNPVFLRREKETVLGNALPPKKEERVLLHMNHEQLAFYERKVREIHESDTNIILGAIQEMLMMCSHPRLVEASPAGASAKQLEEESPKLRWTIEKMKEIRRARQKVLIFTRYKQMQAILRQTINEEFGIDAKIINGEVTGNRLDVVSEFNSKPGFQVLILSPKAAGVGLNIVSANHVIHYTREWNPAVENQATDRCHRIGQTKPVFVYYPIMTAESFVSTEVRLDEIMRLKRDLMKSVIVPSNLEISWKDFEDLF